uniref:Uncharacterized protein n=1 Tax=Pseudoalteromonas rubra TaxID=43658 RepID=A0A0F4QIH1_9GAMM|nr:hypothetical protein TW77_16450 [Pseudoalteromonas rubra]
MKVSLLILVSSLQELALLGIFWPLVIWVVFSLLLLLILKSMKWDYTLLAQIDYVLFPAVFCQEGLFLIMA